MVKIARESFSLFISLYNQMQRTFSYIYFIIFAFLYPSINWEEIFPFWNEFKTRDVLFFFLLAVDIWLQN